MITLGQTNIDNIKRMITLTGDNIKRLSLYQSCIIILTVQDEQEASVIKRVYRGQFQFLIGLRISPLGKLTRFELTADMFLFTLLQSA